MLPPFNSAGDLPAGIHATDWTEFEQRFGQNPEGRVRAHARLRHLHELEDRTGALLRFIVFGSFVSASVAPRDIDVVLVMAADYRLEDAPRESRTLFSHPDAEARYGASVEEARLEDYVVSGLVDFDDISNDEHADLLYGLATQTVEHFKTYLSEDDTRKVLRCYQRDIAKFIHVQMQEHYWEDAVGYEVKVSKGFTELRPSAYSSTAQQPVADYRVSPSDKSNMAKDSIYMLEPKMKIEMTDAVVIAKRDVAVAWCKRASEYAATHRGKPWRYVLIPHDAIAENMTLAGLAKQFGD